MSVGLPPRSPSTSHVPVTCDERQIRLLSAARRHVADAERLLQESPDQAWHLAGFGPECARKAGLFDGGLAARVVDQRLGHDFGPFADQVLDWVSRLDRHAHRYQLDGWTAQYPVLGSWSPNHRYDATGTVTTRDVNGLVATARQLVDRVSAELWMDGLLPKAWGPTS